MHFFDYLSDKELLKSHLIHKQFERSGLKLCPPAFVWHCQCTLVEREERGCRDNFEEYNLFLQETLLT